MSFHSAQVHLALAKLICKNDIDISMEDVECRTIDLDGNVAYRITARGTAGVLLARMLTATVGQGRADPMRGDALLGMDAARRLMEIAHSATRRGGGAGVGREAA